MNIQRKNALITGYSLVLMALVAGFAIGYAFPKFYDKNSLETLPQLLTANTGLYRQMLGTLWLIVILDILVSWTLYQFFKPDNRRLSVVSLILRLVYTLLFGVAICYLFANSAGVMDPVEINNNYSSFEHTWAFGLIVFGGHLFVIGLLMRLHQFIPKWLWILTLFAGVSYVVVHLLKVALPDSAEVVNTLNNILALPMMLGEMCLAVWLILKGGKPNQKQHTSS